MPPFVDQDSSLPCLPTHVNASDHLRILGTGRFIYVSRCLRSLLERGGTQQLPATLRPTQVLGNRTYPYISDRCWDGVVTAGRGRASQEPVDRILAGMASEFYMLHDPSGTGRGGASGVMMHVSGIPGMGSQDQ